MTIQTNPPNDIANDHGPNGDSQKLTRRRLLGSAAGMAAVAAASALMPPNVRRALAESPPKTNSLRDIKHIVLLMQENRSFDHYFGTLAGVRGFDDPKALQLSDRPVGVLSARPRKSERLSAAVSFGHPHDQRAKNSLDEPRLGRAAQRLERRQDGQLAAGPSQGRRRAKAPYVMGYHTRADIPFQFALAEAFTICDAYHCSVMGPTWPNRMYWMTGTIDPEGHDGGPMTSNKAIPKGFRWTTYAERLEKAGVSWKVYQQQDNYGCNMLENFKAFQRGRQKVAAVSQGNGARAGREVRTRRDERQAAGRLVDHPDQHRIRASRFHAGRRARRSWPARSTRSRPIRKSGRKRRSFSTTTKTTASSTTFRRRCRRPARRRNSCAACRSAAGFRVPCIIVSPWTAGGWVCSQPFDHTSVLQLLEKFTGVAEPNITDWRRQNIRRSDIRLPLRFRQGRSAEAARHRQRAAAAPNTKWPISPSRSLPGAAQTPPKQEKGSRKRVPRKEH